MENTTTFITPSGFSLTIKDHNGEEEGYLSVPADMESGANVLNYLSAVIVDSSLGQSKFTSAEIAKWRVNDKYFALVMARIHNHGEILKFKHEFEKSKIKVPFNIDLREYVWDFGTNGKPLPKEGEVNREEPWLSYYPWRIAPYVEHYAQTGRELTLSSGKLVRYTFLNSIGEAKTRTISKERLNSNIVFTARNLQWKGPETGDIWSDVQNFSIFNAKDLKELRYDIQCNEPRWDLMTDLKDPNNGEVEYVNLLNIADFFFPTGI